MPYERYWYLKSVHLFDRLDIAAFDRLKRISRSLAYTYHTRLPATEDDTDRIYLIQEGRLRIVREVVEASRVSARPDDTRMRSPLVSLSRGKGRKEGGPAGGKSLETIVVLEPGDLFGEIRGTHPPSDTWIESMDEVRLLRVNRGAWFGFLRRWPLALEQSYWKGGRRHRRLQPLKDMTGRTVTSRLAECLLSLAQEAHLEEHAWHLPFRLTEARWGRWVGASEEKVRDILVRLEQEGIIRRRRGRIALLDFWQLKKWSRKRAFELTPLPEPKEEDPFSWFSLQEMPPSDSTGSISENTTRSRDASLGSRTNGLNNR